MLSLHLSLRAACIYNRLFLVNVVTVNGLHAREINLRNGRNMRRELSQCPQHQTACQRYSPCLGSSRLVVQNWQQLAQYTAATKRSLPVPPGNSNTFLSYSNTFLSYSNTFLSYSGTWVCAFESQQSESHLLVHMLTCLLAAQALGVSCTVSFMQRCLYRDNPWFQEFTPMTTRSFLRRCCAPESGTLNAKVPTAQLHNQRSCITSTKHLYRHVQASCLRFYVYSMCWCIL